MKYVGFWFWWDDSDVWVTTERIWKQFFDVSMWWRRSESVNLCSAGELILLVLGRSRILKTLKLIQDSLQEQLIYYLVLIWDQRAHFFFFLAKTKKQRRAEMWVVQQRFVICDSFFVFNLFLVDLFVGESIRSPPASRSGFSPHYLTSTLLMKRSRQWKYMKPFSVLVQGSVT